MDARTSSQDPKVVI